MFLIGVAYNVNLSFRFYKCNELIVKLNENFYKRFTFKQKHF